MVANPGLSSGHVTQVEMCHAAGYRSMEFGEEFWKKACYMSQYNVKYSEQCVATVSVY